MQEEDLCCNGGRGQLAEGVDLTLGASDTRHVGLVGGQREETRKAQAYMSCILYLRHVESIIKTPCYVEQCIGLSSRSENWAV